MRLAIAMFTGALLIGDAASAQDAKPRGEPRLTSLPDNPCDLLTPAQLAEATGLPVVAAARKPDIFKLVRAQRENRDPEPGRICSYETGTAVGAVSLYVPKREERSTLRYWESRTRYLERPGGIVDPIAGLGADAWLSGKASLHVLVCEDEHFTVSVQHYHPDNEELLIRVARRVLDRF